LDTFVYVDGDKIKIKSTAALNLLKRMGIPWGMMYAFIIVPKPIRDAVYMLIAKNRYKWFGKKDSCMIPDPAMKQRFLDWHEAKKN
jgi:predicted DCC family thiol-disulfide oxidoreductase YuxK